MLSYNELCDLCEKKHVTITEVARNSRMTLSGFRNAMRKYALTADKIVLVCEFLQITPNDFFQVKNKESVHIGSQNQFGQNQVMNQVGIDELKSTIDLLRNELSIKNMQLAQKDEQINQLLTKL